MGTSGWTWVWNILLLTGSYRRLGAVCHTGKELHDQLLCNFLLDSVGNSKRMQWDLGHITSCSLSGDEGDKQKPCRGSQGCM